MRRAAIALLTAVALAACTGDPTAAPPATEPSTSLPTPTPTTAAAPSSAAPTVPPSTVPDRRAMRIGQVGDVGRWPVDVVVAFDAVWVLARTDGWVSRIDPATGDITARIPLGDTGMRRRLAVTDTAVVVGGDPLLLIDPRTNAVTEVPVGVLGSAVVADGDVLFVAGFDGVIRRVRTTEVTTLASLGLTTPLVDLAVAQGLLWVLVQGRGSDANRLLALDPETGVVVHDLPVGPLGEASSFGLSMRLVADDRLVVVGNDPARPDSGELVLVDPVSAAILARPRVAAVPTGIALTPDRIWTTVGAVDRGTFEVTPTELLGGGLAAAPDGSLWGTVGWGGGTAIHWLSRAFAG